MEQTTSSVMRRGLGTPQMVGETSDRNGRPHHSLSFSCAPERMLFFQTPKTEGIQRVHDTLTTYHGLQGPLTRSPWQYFRFKPSRAGVPVGGSGATASERARPGTLYQCCPIYFRCLGPPDRSIDGLLLWVPPANHPTLEITEI